MALKPNPTRIRLIAAARAAGYLSVSGFSCQGLIRQLSSDFGDKYTPAQAEWAASASLGSSERQRR